MKAPQPLAVTTLEFAVLRMANLCVDVQQDLVEFLTTASVSADPAATAMLRWLRKRGVRIALLSDWSAEATATVLERIRWTVGEEGLVQCVVYDQQAEDNPVRSACELLGYSEGRAGISFTDTPRLLEAGRRAGIYFNVAFTNGQSTYNELAREAHHAMLDQPVQLVNFLVEHSAPRRAGLRFRIGPPAGETA